MKIQLIHKASGRVIHTYEPFLFKFLPDEYQTDEYVLVRTEDA